MIYTLGDPDLAIVLGVFAQQNNLTIWEPLLDGVAQSSSELIPDDTKQQAYESLKRAMEHHDGRDVIKAILLYTWLLTQSESTPEKRAYLQNNLGEAYSTLPTGDRAANLSQAIACYEAALKILQRVHAYYASVVSKNVEIARNELQNLASGEE